MVQKIANFLPFILDIIFASVDNTLTIPRHQKTASYAHKRMALPTKTHLTVSR